MKILIFGFLVVAFHIKSINNEVVCTHSQLKFGSGSTFHCSDHQSCCGTSCCSGTSSQWYIWVVLTIAIFVCCAVSCIVRFKKLHRKVRPIIAVRAEDVPQTAETEPQQSTPVVTDYGVFHPESVYKLPPYTVEDPLRKSENSTRSATDNMPSVMTPPPPYESIPR